MIITTINVKRFKSFGNSEAKTVSGLSLINLIFGDNSSGKSNILKFLKLLFSPKLTRQNIEVEGASKVREESGPFYEGTIVDEPYIFHKRDRSEPITFSVSVTILKEEIEKSGYTSSDIFIKKIFKKNTFISVEFVGVIESLNDPYTTAIKLNSVNIGNKPIFNDTGKTKEYFKGIAGMEGDSSALFDFLAIFNSLVFFLDKDRFLMPEYEKSTVRKLTPGTFKNWLHNISLNAIEDHKYEGLIAFIKKYGEIGVLKQFNPSFSKDEMVCLKL